MISKSDTSCSNLFLVLPEQVTYAKVQSKEYHFYGGSLIYRWSVKGCIQVIAQQKQEGQHLIINNDKGWVFFHVLQYSQRIDDGIAVILCGYMRVYCVMSFCLVSYISLYRS